MAFRQNEAKKLRKIIKENCASSYEKTIRILSQRQPQD